MPPPVASATVGLTNAGVPDGNVDALPGCDGSVRLVEDVRGALFISGAFNRCRGRFQPRAMLISTFDGTPLR